ncbi:hypothetical protein TCDM_09243 [Trypanosoma cruzi Dm28c]|uniref:Uncharacterized protein n=1 Tax=Trypanosoma cruzi Dm28c TaxID=1416333 RepID=V5D6C1_TRYCR|nr:hypothetical protein TCDM_09243 [Trypanosoma cruzi Dm28c]
MPRELNPCVTTLTRQMQCLPHTGRYAGASDRGGVGSSGRLRSFRAKFFACLRWGIRDAATACARDGELRWPQQPSVFVRDPGSEAGQCGLFPLVRVESVRGFPFACYGGAARFGLVSFGPNNTLGQCDHAGAPCVCELCVVECFLGLCITSSVPGHVQNASHQGIQNRRHVLACFHVSAKRCIHARRRGRSLGEYRTLCANTKPLCICCGA